MGTRRRRWLWLSASAALVSILALSTRPLLAAGTRGAEIATVLALPVAVVSGLLTLVFGIAALRQVGSSRQESELAHEASRLAGAVRKREGATLALLLADTGDVRSVEVRFERRDEVPARSDGGEKTGSSLWIADYFNALSRGRLVIVGPAGSGKTVLAIRLVSELAKVVQSAPARAQEGVPHHHTVIPVRVSAPAFGSVLGTSDLAQMAGSDLSDRFDKWLIDELAFDYGVPRKHAIILVGRGWVIPVLDGVDEMDEVGTVPRRAAALIAAMNQPTERGPRTAVLTCRTDTYAKLGSAQSAYLGERDVLQDATTIEVQPLLASAVRDYLQTRFPDPAGSTLAAPSWRPVLARLHAEQPGDPLLDVMQSPLRLFLAVTASRGQRSDPQALIQRAAGMNLDDHLFSELIPVLAASRPGAHGDRYPAEDVTRWLTTLAGYLQAEERAGRSGTDLRPEGVWRAAGERGPRFGVAVALTGAAALAVFFWARGLVMVGLPRDAFVAAGVAVSVSLVGLVAWGSLRRATVTHRLDIRKLRTRGGRRRFALWFFGGLAVGLIYGCAVALAGGFAGGQVAELADGIAFGLSGGAVLGVSLGFAFGLATRPDAILRPGQLVTEGVAHSAARLGVGFAAGLALGFGGGLAQGLVFGPLLALVAISTSPWPRYGLACILLAARRDSPCQLARFLDWACESGLMRVAGPAVQFRHREFQAWLARPA